MKKNILIFGSNAALIRSAIQMFIKKNFKVIGISKSNKNNFQKNKNYTHIKFNIEKDNIFKICKKIDKIMNVDSIIYAIGGSKGKNKLVYPTQEWKNLWWYNFGYSIEINNFFIEKMKKKKFGRILYFSTTAVNLKSGPAIYSSTKAALEDYVKKTGRNYADKNIYINAIKTSIVSDKNNNWYKFENSKSTKTKRKFLTSNLATGKFGRSEYFINLIDSMVTENNYFMTGSVVDIDGGSFL